MTAGGNILSYSSDKKGVVSEKLKIEDHSQEIVSLRPGCFDEYVGQAAAVETLKIAIQAAKMRRRITSYNVCYTKLLRAVWLKASDEYPVSNSKHAKIYQRAPKYRPGRFFSGLPPIFDLPRAFFYLPVFFA